MMRAAQAGHLQVVTYLVEAGADRDAGYKVCRVVNMSLHGVTWLWDEVVSRVCD